MILVLAREAEPAVLLGGAGCAVRLAEEEIA
jgi:hypothetical protein